MNLSQTLIAKCLDPKNYRITQDKFYVINSTDVERNRVEIVNDKGVKSFYSKTLFYQFHFIASKYYVDTRIDTGSVYKVWDSEKIINVITERKETKGKTIITFYDSNNNIFHKTDNFELINFVGTVKRVLVKKKLRTFKPKIDHIGLVIYDINTNSSYRIKAFYGKDYYILKNLSTGKQLKIKYDEIKDYTVE